MFNGVSGNADYAKGGFEVRSIADRVDGSGELAPRNRRDCMARCQRQELLALARVGPFRLRHLVFWH